MKKALNFLIFFLNVLLVFSIVLSTNYSLSDNLENNSNPISSKNSKISYVDHSWIQIDNNSHFEYLATVEGWSGNGTSSNPYLITNLNITHDSSYVGIRITGTTVHFNLSNNYISCATRNIIGIFLNGVTNGIVSNNIIYNEQDGIVCFSSSFCYLIDNQLNHTSRYGFNLENSFNITISSNNISNAQYGIRSYSGCYNNMLSNNKIFQSLLTCDYGIVVYENTYTVIDGNSISNAAEAGLLFSHSFSSLIKSNILFQNLIGLYLDYCGLNLIENNEISFSTDHV